MLDNQDTTATQVTLANWNGSLKFIIRGEPIQLIVIICVGVIILVLNNLGVSIASMSLPRLWPVTTFNMLTSLKTLTYCIAS
jgi:hypothetical protein